MKSPQKRRCRRCCTTGTCSMRQSHSIHCNSRGYDLISLVTSHCSLETSRSSSEMSHSSSEMSYSRSEIATRHLEMLQRLWDCHIVLLHELCDCCTAVRQTENFRYNRRANPLLKKSIILAMCISELYLYCNVRSTIAWTGAMFSHNHLIPSLWLSFDSMNWVQSLNQWQLCDQGKGKKK